MKHVLTMFKSKKFVMWFATLLVPILNSKFGWGIELDVILGMFGVTGATTIGQGIADAGSKGKTSSMTGAK